MTAKLIYCYDPMCSWCWGFKPTWNELRTLLAPLVEQQKLEIHYLLGGLAPDSDQPMPPEMQTKLQGVWQQISAHLGTEFNHAFWQECQPRRSTYPACRACLVAREAGLEEKMITEIQQAYYLKAQNPSDIDTLAQCAENIGLNKAEFIDAIAQVQQTQSLEKELAQARQLQLNSFPSLGLIVGNRIAHIELDYKSAKNMLQTIELGMRQLSGEGE